MIYLKNKTLLQDVYIPRQDMLPYTTGSSGTYAEGYSDGYEDGTQGQKDKLVSTAFTENGLYTREDGWNEVEVSVEAPLPVLEDKTVVISADTTTVTPSSGYDGMSQVIVDASEYAQENYDGGFEDGFEDGYSSGSTDEKAKLSGVTFTSNTAVTLSDGGYSAVTVNVPQTGHTDQELEDAYESGYTSGQTDQKNLLTTTAFTENGSYQRENGWSGITVNIDTASTYNSGYTDGYDSGYTSGETHQKSLLVSTAFTENGEYQRENGYSAITVNVPTGQTYNVEENHPFTANSNGSYTIEPSNWSVSYSGNGRTIIFEKKGNSNPSAKTLVYDIEHLDNPSSYIEISILPNGIIDYDDEEWNRSQYGGFSWSVSNNLYYIEFYDVAWIDLDVITETNEGRYDVMSAVSLNVNVDTASTYQSGYTDGYEEAFDDVENGAQTLSVSANGTYNTGLRADGYLWDEVIVNVPQSGGSGTTKIFFADYIHTETLQENSSYRIDTGIYPTTATTFRVKGMGKGFPAGNELVGFNLYDAGEESDYRLFCYSTSGEILGFDWYSERITNENWGGLTDGKSIDLTCSNYQVYDNINETVLLSGNPQSNMSQGIPIYVNVGSWWLKGLEIWEGNTKVFDGVAAYDENGTVGLYDSVSNEIITNTELTMVYEFDSGSSIPLSSITITANTAITSSAVAFTGITVNVPQTGSSAVLGTKTITENGTYSASTDSLDGYSAITVNVPTSGGSVKYLEYIETDGTEIGWDTGYNIGTDIDAKIYLDFMPISGSGYGDYWFAYYGDGEENVLFRRGGNNSPIGFMFGNNRTYIDTSTYSVVDGNRYLISLDKNGITDENTGTLLVAASSSSINSIRNLYLNCGGQVPLNRCIRARYYSFRVENGNGNTTLDMRPCLDGNDVPCFYDEVSKQYIYHSGSGTPIAGPVIHSSDYISGFTDGYASGFTDGYASGYTDGQDSIISTFTAITATTNGVYGSSANPLSSITVNVPQTGSAAVTGVISITGNGIYYSSSDNFDGYSAVTVNVDAVKIIPVSSIHHSDIGDGKNYFLDTGIYPTTATTVRVKGVGAGYYPNNGFVYAEVNKSSVADSDWMFSIQKDIDPAYNLLDFSIKSIKRTIADWGEPSVGRQIDVTCSDFEMIDNISQSSVTASTISFTSSGTLKVNVGCWWLKGIQIWEASELVFDGIAAYDENGHIGLYDNVSGVLVYDPDYTMVYENPVLGNVTLTANGIYNASNFGTEGFSAVTVNVDDNYGELIGLYCQNCQFVLSYKQYLENTSIEFGIRTGGASINITSGATAPYVNRIEVDSNGNVSGNSYSYDGSGGVSTGSGITSVVLNAFPTKNYMLIDTDTKNTTKVNGLSASTCINHSSTPANNLLLSIDDGYFYGGAINNTGSDLQSCIFPHVDSDGNACILGSYGLFYPISGECYPIYKNGNNYYVLMKSQPWNQQ